MIEKTERLALIKALASTIKEYVSNATSGIMERLGRLEQKVASIPAPEKGEKGDKGEPDKDGESIIGPPGKDAEVNESAIVKKILKHIPIPKDGRDGSDGKDGEPGPPGQDGKDGRDGRDAIIDYEAIISKTVQQIPTPKDGKDGEPGPSGPAGPPGESIKGEKGDPGESVIGPQGPPGKDAVVDTAAIVLEVMSKIPKPKDGKDGAPGKDGKDAEIDYDILAEKVAKLIPVPKDGRDGKDGQPGIRGTPGEKGERGERGPQGEAGRDAPQIDILPSVDLTRSYPRGTFACYQNGLIHSFRNTVPGDSLEKSGWEVVMGGTWELKPEMSDDSRQLTVITAKTGDEIQKTSCPIPAMIYRGIYKAGEKYMRGDVATWGGSAWHCQKDNVKSAPGDKNDDWKLMVKEGRRGKDGKEGPPGPEGPPGKDRFILEDK